MKPVVKFYIYSCKDTGDVILKKCFRNRFRRTKISYETTFLKDYVSLIEFLRDFRPKFIEISEQIYYNFLIQKEVKTIQKYKLKK